MIPLFHNNGRQWCGFAGAIELARRLAAGLPGIDCHGTDDDETDDDFLGVIRDVEHRAAADKQGHD